MKRTVNPSKILALLLSLVLAASVFAGCGGTAGSSAGTVSAPASSEAGQTVSDKGDPSAAVKTITFKAVHKDGSEKSFEISTEADNLRAALEQENLIQGDESEYGLFVKTVDGETADSEKEEWWCLTDKDGNMTPTGVDSTEIADGDSYTFTFTVGYDS